jgi:hypothetical protein
MCVVPNQWVVQEVSVSMLHTPNSLLQHFPVWQIVAQVLAPLHVKGPPEPERQEAWFWIAHVPFDELQHAPVLAHGVGWHAVPEVQTPPEHPLMLVAIEHTPVVLLQHAPFTPHKFATQVVASRQVPKVHWVELAYTVQEFPEQQLPAVSVKVVGYCGNVAHIVFAPSQLPPAAPHAPCKSSEHEPFAQQAPVAPHELVAQEVPLP